MSFEGPAEGYDSFMGRYARPLAPLFAELAGVDPGMRVLDVGSGPGALTEILAGLVGPDHVAAAEPSPSFAAACAARVPDADLREAPAEDLPWEDGTFDAALAQLVLHFMTDPPAGLREMQRVVKPGAVVAGCTWDTAGRMTMLGTFWEAALALDPSAPAERGSTRLGRPEELRELGISAGLDAVSVEPLDVSVTYRDFHDFWDPFTAGVGPAGAYCASLDPAAQTALGEECRRRLGNPDAAFELPARAWALRGRRPG
jgi:SAM-dependent methyltransferase